MDKEAIKLAILPRGSKLIEGEEIKYYLVLGIVATNKDINWEKDFVTMESAIGSPITGEIEKMTKMKLDEDCGDANSVLMKLHNTNRNELEEL